MLMELLATVVCGFAAAGVVLLANRLIGNRMPRWIVPAVGGIAMLSYQVWSEYTWYTRTAATLPEGVTVTETFEESAPWRPWTYAVPQVNRFAAVDVAGARRNPKVPGHVLADILVFSRYLPVYLVPNLVDCPGARRANLTDGAEFDEDGRMTDADWVEVGPGDPVVMAVCTREDRSGDTS